MCIRKKTTWAECIANACTSNIILNGACKWTPHIKHRVLRLIKLRLFFVVVLLWYFFMYGKQWNDVCWWQFFHSIAPILSLFFFYVDATIYANANAKLNILCATHIIFGFVLFRCRMQYAYILYIICMVRWKFYLQTSRWYLMWIAKMTRTNSNSGINHTLP